MKCDSPRAYYRGMSAPLFKVSAPATFQQYLASWNLSSVQELYRAVETESAFRPDRETEIEEA